MSKKLLNDYEWHKEPMKPDELQINEHNRHQMRDLLNQTGPGFCLAKWTQVTMHLGNGLTHSCHHPGAHSIPLDELEKDPGALHNTQFKKERRIEMLNGKRPDECDFCWRVEDNGEFSDRVLKSIPSFSSPHHDTIARLKGDEDVYPTYVEVSFGRTCNFACAYCGPPFSSKWEQEIKQQGPYNIFNQFYNTIKEEETHYTSSEHNPYIEAFWKWFPEAYKHMHTFRITGGEPLLIKDTFKVMDFLIENPNPNLNFAVNSNACPPGKLWDEFIEKTKILLENNCVKQFELYTSAEATGAQNDFIRDGMNWELFVNNIERFLSETPGAKVVFMCAFNVLSASTFLPLLEWIHKLKQDYNYHGLAYWLEEEGYFKVPQGSMSYAERKKIGTGTRVLIDVPYLRHPQFLDAVILTPKMINDYLIPAVNYMYENCSNHDWIGNRGFEDHECLKLKRNVIQCITRAKNIDEHGLTTIKELAHVRAKFAFFMKQYSKRRGKDFLKTFPEYAEFYEVCMREYRRIYGAPVEETDFSTGIEKSNADTENLKKAKELAKQKKQRVTEISEDGKSYTVKFQ